MSDEIPPDLVDKTMVKCARRCCICRRFRPTKLQVHHIRERSKGSSDEEANLIVSCLCGPEARDGVDAGIDRNPFLGGRRGRR
jgi:hypothetical protein